MFGCRLLYYTLKSDIFSCYMLLYGNCVLRNFMSLVRLRLEIKLFAGPADSVK